MPEGDTLFRTAAGLRPYLVGRDVLAARAQGPGPVPQIQRVIGKRVDAVESQGKNLLIRFDGGLELRTHLRMNGSWHRYRPGERWRRPPGRARLVLEVDGSVAVCFDAPVVELFETRAEQLHPSPHGSGPTCSHPTSMQPKRIAAIARAASDIDQRRVAGPACPRGPRQHLRNETLFAERVDPFVAVADVDDERLDRVIATAQRLLTASAGVAPGRAPTRVYRKTGRPCPRCGTPIRSAPLSAEMPRTTYWCPNCQGGVR